MVGVICTSASAGLRMAHKRPKVWLEPVLYLGA